MTANTEQTDALLEWQPGPSDAAHENPLHAFSWGVRRALGGKLLLLYLWIGYVVIVDGAGRVLMALLRGRLSWGAAAAELLSDSGTGAAFGADVFQTVYRVLILESLTRQPFAPTVFFVLFYGVIAGGVIRYLHAPRPAPLMAQLGAASGVYAGRFVRILFIGGAATWMVTQVGERIAASGVTDDAPRLTLGLLLALLIFLAAIVDYVRIRTVARDSRSMILETARTASFFVANLPRMAALEALVLLSVVAVAALCIGAFGALQAVFEPRIAGLVTRQALIIGLLGVRVATWGAMLSLYQGITLRRLSEARRS